MKTTINKLHELTGRDRRTIRKRLVGITPEADGRRMLYDSAQALAAIYGESLPRQRIPVEDRDIDAVLLRALFPDNRH